MMANRAQEDIVAERNSPSTGSDGRQLIKMFKKAVGASILLKRAQKAVEVSQEIAKMTEFNDKGWAPIHDAAAKGYVRSLERFIEASADQIELETTDSYHYTPLLIASIHGHTDVMTVLLNAGASLTCTTPSSGGIIENCVMKTQIKSLEFYIDLKHVKLPAWKKLIQFLQSTSDDECEATARCLCIMTEKETHIQSAFHHGAVPALVTVLKGGCEDQTKLQSVKLLDRLLQGPKEVMEQLNSSGGIPALVKLLKSPNSDTLQTTATVLKKIAEVKDFGEQAAQNSAIQNLIKILETVHDPEVLVDVVDCLTVICNGNESHQTAACSAPNGVSTVVGLYEECTHKGLLQALTNLVSKLSFGLESNQNAFVSGGITTPLVFLLRVKYRELQLAAVEAIFSLANGNSYTASLMIDDGVVMPLIQLLKRGRMGELQERCACALWALAGENLYRRREMANMIGVQYLIEFLGSMQESLHYIGSEGLGVLAQGPETKQTQIGNQNGIHPLVRHLQSNKEHIVLSVIRTLRHLCIGVGYIPHKKNQGTLLQAKGLKILVTLMVHSKNELVQVEAAMALAAAALGNQEILDELHQFVDFSYVRILRLLYSTDDLVRLLAGAALATFAYNNWAQQKEIAEQGGVRFQHYVPFLKSNDEYFRCNAAFQIVVLSRIIPDEEQAVTSAVGIKLIVDLFQDSQSPDILALASDCIARLAHTRAGVPAAIVSIDTPRLLLNLLYSEDPQVRGCAAIALGYLTYNHAAEREILHRCRFDPYLMKAIKFYVKTGKVAPRFEDGWKHSKKIGLPPIGDGRPNLVAQKTQMFDAKEFCRPLTIMSLNDNATSARMQTSTSTVAHKAEEEEEEEEEVEAEEEVAAEAEAEPVEELNSAYDAEAASAASSASPRVRSREYLEHDKLSVIEE